MVKISHAITITKKDSRGTSETKNYEAETSRRKEIKDVINYQKQAESNQQHTSTRCKTKTFTFTEGKTDDTFHAIAEDNLKVTLDLTFLCCPVFFHTPHTDQNK